MNIRIVLLLACGAVLQIYGSRLRQDDFPPRIVEHPSDHIVSRGDPATLNCQAEGRPAPSIEWYKDGERVETNHEEPRSHRTLLPTGALFFLRIFHGRRSKSDEGSYVCIARNYLGEATSRNASLEVALLRDEFRQNPNDVVAAAGEPAVLECQPPRGHPEPSVSWRKNGARLNDNDERVTVRGGKLMISNIRKADAGMYVCVGTNMVGERTSSPAELTVFERPKILKRPSNLVALAASEAEFHCEVIGDPPPTVSWYKDDEELPKGRYEIKNGLTLRLHSVRGSDEGTYTCVAENRVGKTESSASLVVHAPPQFVMRPRDQIVAQGQTANFLCKTTGNPQPAVFWQKEGSQTLIFPNQPPQAGRFLVSPTGHLTIERVQRSDAGYYICQALSVAGSILSKAQLEVGDALSDTPPPIIRQGPANRTLAVGSSLLLPCQTMGNPPPSVHWLKDSVRLPSAGPRLALFPNGSLRIKVIQLLDSGLYTCIATSPSGETKWSAFVEVQDSGQPSERRPPDPSSLPPPPSKPQVTDVSKSAITLSWMSGSSSGSSESITYTVEALSQSLSSSWQTVTSGITSQSYTLHDLWPNTIYLFLVRAANAHGLSDPSPVSDPVRTQDVSPPGQGVDHRQVQRELGEVTIHLHNPVTASSSSAQLSWTVDRQSQFVQGYRVLFRPVVGGQAVGSWQILEVESPAERGTLLPNLRKGTEYEVKVRPFFNEFQGMDSALKHVHMPEEAPEAAPQGIAVLPMQGSNGSITITWDPPPADLQNGVIQEYKVWCFGNETRFNLNKSAAGVTRYLQLTGLVPGVPYRIQVAAATATGVGPRSEPQNVVLAFGGGAVSVEPGSNVSLAGQITDVVKQPAFIAGIGGACWVILMGFSVWIYCRRKKRKGLSNYAGKYHLARSCSCYCFLFPITVTFQRTQGTVMSNGRPGVLNPGDPSYPWLADSWPNTGLQITGTSNCSVSCCAHPGEDGSLVHADTSFVGPSTGDGKSSTLSSDGAIYSSIDVSREATFYSPGQTQHATPYASTQIIQQNLANELSAERGGSRSEKLGSPALPFAPQESGRLANADRRGPTGALVTGQGFELNSLGSQHGSDRSSNSSGGRAKRKTRGNKGKAGKATGVNWSEFLPPPPNHPPPNSEGDTITDLAEDGYDSDECLPPLPARLFINDGACEKEALSGPWDGLAGSYGNSSLQQASPEPETRQQSRQGMFVPTPRPPSPCHTYGTTMPDSPSECQPFRGTEFVPCSSDDCFKGSLSGPAIDWSSASDFESVCVDTNGWHGSPEARLANGKLGAGAQAEPGSHFRPRPGKRQKHGACKMDDLPPPPLPPPLSSPGNAGVMQHKGCGGLGWGMAGGTMQGSVERLYPDDGEESWSLDPHSLERQWQPPRSRPLDETHEDIIPYSRPHFPSKFQLAGHSSAATMPGKAVGGGKKETRHGTSHQS
uniref:roundabout homolog 2-like isoform X3 n=1 Tax=Myxine glutinosa TaxID=7769 RepID=UPI00358EAB62